MADTENTRSNGQRARQMATGDRAILPEGARTISIYVMGKQYEVPETLTIMKAMEYAGFKFIRGAGCRGGICGACPTVYRKAGDYKLHFGLACQTVVEPNIYLTQIPFYPANRTSYDLDEMKADPESIYALYPELFRCVACNNCTKACPMDIEVLDYVSALKQGGAADLAPLFCSVLRDEPVLRRTAFFAFENLCRVIEGLLGVFRREKIQFGDRASNDLLGTVSEVGLDRR